MLGKKFALHDIQFILPANKIKLAEEGGIEGKVVNILDYVDKVYYEVEVGSEKLLVAAKKADYKVGDKLKLDIDVNDIGIYDVNFGVRLL